MCRRYVRARGRCLTSYTMGSVDFCIDELFKRPVFTDGQVRVLVLRAFACALIVISPLRRYLSLVMVYGFRIKKTISPFFNHRVSVSEARCWDRVIRLYSDDRGQTRTVRNARYRWRHDENDEASISNNIQTISVG